ncbi:DgyrCDS9177 [Dimorphilus gyrociliatus]|uniref:DgyrCDS9177 n=1 Tax=Dimorphilus gyrociliatus TaxID=2664684 RepID=A0A7I8VXJ9_9ANNE|nr:DgyrCDS9177 [Dimorphilus gyrociliatus]
MAFSPLAQGFASWNGPGAVDFIDSDKKVVPKPKDMGYSVLNTVPNYRCMSAPVDRQKQEALIPKTYLTRRGRLLLFSGPSDKEMEEMNAREGDKLRNKLKKMSDSELQKKFGSLSRLAQSILSFGDGEYNKEHCSISDPANKTYLNFLHDLNSAADHELKRESTDDYLQQLRRHSASWFRSLRNNHNLSEDEKQLQEALLLLARNSPDTESCTSSTDSRPSSAQAQFRTFHLSSRSPKTVQRLSSEELKKSLRTRSSLMFEENPMETVEELTFTNSSRPSTRPSSEILYQRPPSSRSTKTPEDIAEQMPVPPSSPSGSESEISVRIRRKQLPDHPRLEDGKETKQTMPMNSPKSPSTRSNTASTGDFRPLSGRYLPPTPVLASTSRCVTPPWRRRNERKYSSHDEQHAILKDKAFSDDEPKTEIVGEVNNSRKSSIKSNRSASTENEAAIEDPSSYDVFNRDKPPSIEENNVIVDHREIVIDKQQVSEPQQREMKSDLSNHSATSSNRERPVSAASVRSRLLTPDRMSARSDSIEKHVQFVQSPQAEGDGEDEEKSVAESEGEKLLKKRPTSSKRPISARQPSIEINRDENESENLIQSDNKKNRNLPELPKEDGSAAKKEKLRSNSPPLLSVSPYDNQGISSSKKDVSSSAPIKKILKSSEKQSKTPPKSSSPTHKKPPLSVKFSENQIKEFKRSQSVLSSIDKKMEEEKKLEKEMDQILSNTFSIEEGLSAEELALEAEIIKNKLKSAAENVVGGEKKGETKSKARPKSKSPKMKRKQKQEDGDELEKKRQSLREAKRLERQKRLEEAQALEAKIKEIEHQNELKKQEVEGNKKIVEAEIQAATNEVMEAERAEEDARNLIAEQRKQYKEQREAKRRAEQEKKREKERLKREEEKARLEAARKRELQMLETLASAEEKRKLREEERKRKEEQEREEQERLAEEEEEERKQRQLEDEEMEEMERAMEEEALKKIVQAREEAEERQRALYLEKLQMEEESERIRLKMEEEEMQIEMERLEKERQERERLEQERQKLIEIQRLEEEARERMRLELEQRRQILLRRRDINLERHSQLDKIRKAQGVTKSWIFSYFVRWPRENYEKPIGGEPKNKKGGFRNRKPQQRPKTVS